MWSYCQHGGISLLTKSARGNPAFRESQHIHTLCVRGSLCLLRPNLLPSHSPAMTTPTEVSTGAILVFLTVTESNQQLSWTMRRKLHEARSSLRRKTRGLKSSKKSATSCGRKLSQCRKSSAKMLTTGMNTSSTWTRCLQMLGLWIFGMSTSQFEQRNWMKVILEHFCIQVFVQLTRVNNSMRCSWSREAHSSWDLKDSQSRMEGHDSWRTDHQNEARHWWHRSSTSIKGARHTQCANRCIPGLHEDHEQH